MTLKERLEAILTNAVPSWRSDPNGILGKPVAVSRDALPPPPEQPKAHLQPTNLPKNNQSVSFVGNLGGGEKIAKSGGPDILLKSLTSADDSVTITTSADRNEIDFSVNVVGDFTIAVANQGTGEGAVLINTEFEDDTWTIYARTIAAGDYMSVVQTDAEITVNGSSIVVNNTGTGEGAVLINTEWELDEWTIFARTLKASDWIDVSQDDAEITVALKPQPGTGRRFLAFEADGTPVLVGEKTCETPP